MAGCPSDWQFSGYCNTVEECTANVCNTDSQKRQNYRHEYIKCYKEADGVEYSDCYYGGSTKIGCC